MMLLDYCSWSLNSGKDSCTLVQSDIGIPEECMVLNTRLPECLTGLPGGALEHNHLSELLYLNKERAEITHVHVHSKLLINCD